MDVVRTKPTMVNETIAAITAGTALVTYLGLAFLDGIAGFEISLIEKFGGAGAAAGVMYLVITKLLKRNDDLSKKIEELHEKRVAMLDEHYQELKELVKKQ